MTHASKSHRTLDIFVSYCHRDARLKERLLIHLAVLKRAGQVAPWDDCQIVAGDRWEGEIDERLNTSAIILLLLSPDFLASSYCYDKEALRAVERSEAGEARVVPVILSPCEWQHTPLARLQALPLEGKPIASWPQEDAALNDVTTGLRKVINSLAPPDKSTLPPNPIQEPPDSQPSPYSSAQRLALPVNDSGAWLLLGDHFYTADTVQEHANGMFEIQVSPTTTEGEVALRGYRGPGNRSREALRYAYREQAAALRPERLASVSKPSGSLWTLRLSPDAQWSSRRAMSETTFNGIGPDELAEMRARLLLLGERPPVLVPGTVHTHGAFILGDLQRLGITGAIFPDLLKTGTTDEDNLLRQARLWAVYYLKAANICEHILELTLGPVAENGLPVRFQGRRRQMYANREPAVLTVEGICPL